MEGGVDREAVLERYRRAAAQPKRDPGAETRAALLAALRPQEADRPLLEAALNTYEFSGFGAHRENASRLRATALLSLAQLDPDLAIWHALRLLLDHENTEPMSGEPALTALRLLAARGEQHVLFLFAAHSAGELQAEALRALGGVPAPLLQGLLEGVARSDDQLALVGLIDLVTGRPDAAAFASLLAGLVSRSDDLDLVRFAAAQAVASRHEALVAALREVMATTVEGDRREVLAGVLGPG